MKQQEVFKKIGGIITELNEQYEYLKAVDGQLNELELELFLANSHFLTDHLLILTKLNAQNKETSLPVEKTEAPYTQNYFEPVVTPVIVEKTEERSLEINEPEAKNVAEDNPVPSIDLETNSGDNFEFIKEDEPETIRHELILDEADWEEEDEPYVYEELKDELEKEEEIEIPSVPASQISTHQQKQEQPKPEPEQPQPIAAKAAEPAVKEYAKEDVLTINERISAQMAAKNGVAEQLHSQSIGDLKQAINLNDKLLFVKDLFNGYSLAYSEAIDILNRFNNFNEAEAFLRKNYTVKNNWESKPETTQKFYNLLKRRYA